MAKAARGRPESRRPESRRPESRRPESTSAEPTERNTGSDRAVRSRWFDPRLAIGLALVVASIAGVLVVVARADSTMAVFSAKVPLFAGDRVTVDDLTVRRVRLDAAAGGYLIPARLPNAGLVMTRPVGIGELVPISALGTRSGERKASIVVPLGGQLSRSIQPGSAVELWSAAAGQDRDFDRPRVLVGKATVVRLIGAGGMAVGGIGVGGTNSDNSTVSVELQVPRSRTAAVLDAVANGSALSLISATNPVGR